jgi:hypothetical protein
MAVFALVLIVLALVFGAGVVAGSQDPATLDFFNVSIGASGAGIFLAGAVTMLVLLSGIWLLQVGARRARRRRAEVKSLRRAVASKDTAGPVGPGATRADRSDHADPAPGGRRDQDEVDLAARETGERQR